MFQTLFVIPRAIAGVDVFGFGWLLGAWLVASAAILAWSWRRYGWGPATRGQIPMLVVVAFAIVWLLPNLVDPEFDGLPIRGYGVMLLFSVLAGIAISIYRARQVGLDPEIILSLATWFFVAGIFGARLFYVVKNWPKFDKPTLGETLLTIVNLTQGGLVVYGSLLAGGAALLVFIHKNRLPGLAFADLIAPGVVLGVGLGRLGCFLNGCCYGGLSDLPWSVRFPEGSPAYADQAQRGELYVHGLMFKGGPMDAPILGSVQAESQAALHGLRPGEQVASINGVRVHTVDEAHWELLRIFGAGKTLTIKMAGDKPTESWTLAPPAPRSLPVHPAQLYSLIDALLLCVFLLAYEPYKRHDGDLTALVLTIHPITRFLLEIIRVDEEAVFNSGMSISQIVSLLILAGGIALWIYLIARRPRPLVWPGLLQSNDATANRIGSLPRVTAG